MTAPSDPKALAERLDKLFREIEDEYSGVVADELRALTRTLTTRLAEVERELERFRGKLGMAIRDGKAMSLEEYARSENEMRKAAERERDEWKAVYQGLLGASPAVLKSMGTFERGMALRRQLEAAERDLDAAREALSIYGMHALSCASQHYLAPCDCGLTAALSAASRRGSDGRAD